MLTGRIQVKWGRSFGWNQGIQQWWKGLFIATRRRIDQINAAIWSLWVCREDMFEIIKAIRNDDIDQAFWNIFFCIVTQQDDLFIWKVLAEICNKGIEFLIWETWCVWGYQKIKFDLPGCINKTIHGQWTSQVGKVMTIFFYKIGIEQQAEFMPVPIR